MVRTTAAKVKALSDDCGSGKSPRNGDDLTTSVSETQTQWKLMSAASGFASDYKEQRESRSGDQPRC
jgi:hypothetical protein